MKYTEENLRHVLRKLAPNTYDALEISGNFLPDIMRHVAVHTFLKMLDGFVIQKEDAKIFKMAIDNLGEKGQFNFEE